MVNILSDSKTSVLLLVRELGVGGTERQLVETARFLQSGPFHVHVGCFRPDGLRKADLIQAGIPILHLPVRSFRSASVVTGARKLGQYIRDHNIQVVHSFDAPLNVFAVPVAKSVGTPAVISSQRGDRDLTGRSLKLLLRVTDRIVDAVVVNCKWMREYLISSEGVDETKIRLCYNAVDLDRYRRHSSVNRFPEITIGTVCALRPEKQLDVLLRAFAQMHDLNPKLVILGSGPEEERLRALSNELGVTDNVHFEPATSQVPEWLSRIDIFVLPSRTEALSNALMEAMACGCCPVATNVGGNPELIDHGQTGVLFPAGNVPELSSALRGLVTNEQMRKDLAAAATAKMAQFTYARAAETMQMIYSSVLDSKRRETRQPGAGNV